MISSKNAKKTRILLCGACMSGNMGGQALYIAFVDSLKELVGEIKVTVLSKYPADDYQACQELGWEMISFPTQVQILFGIPFFLLANLMRFLKLPWKWTAIGPLKAYTKNDLLVDLSGISFTDDRDFPGLVINCLWLLPAVTSGIPFVKASQAMGPFSQLPVRLASRFFLNRAAAIVARGHVTYKYLEEFISGKTIYELPDVAFLLKPAPDEVIDEVLISLGIEANQSYCVVGPSYVVDDLMADMNMNDYPLVMAAITDELRRLSGLPVLMIPHERAHSNSSIDDLKTCLDAYKYLSNTEDVFILDENYSSQILKGIIARAEVAIGSRFHFMVAAMSSGIPGIAIAWSHKYKEMMEMLGQECYVVSFQQIETLQLLQLVSELWSNRDVIREQMLLRLPQVMENAKLNTVIVKQLLD